MITELLQELPGVDFAYEYVRNDSSIWLGRMNCNFETVFCPSLGLASTSTFEEVVVNSTILYTCPL